MGHTVGSSDPLGPPSRLRREERAVAAQRLQATIVPCLLQKAGREDLASFHYKEMGMFRGIDRVDLI